MASKLMKSIQESTVDEDKKEVRDHADYGFPDESIIFNLG